MNIAFSALLVILLAFPGICALFAYRSERGRPIGVGPLTDELPFGLVISLLLHVVWVLAFNGIGQCLDDPTKVNLNAVLTLLVSPFGRDTKLFTDTRAALTHGWYPVFIAVYFGTLCLASIAFGKSARWIIVTCKLDKRFRFFRWNDWFYLLRGESPHPEVSGDAEIIEVAAVVDGHLYLGALVDYVVNKSGELDVVVLAAASRRKLASKERPNARTRAEAHPPYYAINAEHVVLKYSEIKNLAIRRSEIVPEGEAEPCEPLLFDGNDFY